MSERSILPPSSSVQWSNCYGWVELSQAFPTAGEIADNSSNPFAAMGGAGGQQDSENAKKAATCQETIFSFYLHFHLSYSLLFFD